MMQWFIMLYCTDGEMETIFMEMSEGLCRFKSEVQVY
jgi:hypothetical protein